jgi:hypothetical protein
VHLLLEPIPNPPRPYHASGERIVAAPGDEGQPPGGRITIGGPNIVATFPFDLDGPPAPQRRATEDDPALLLSNAAEVLSQASADLDGDGAAELVFLAGFGGAPERLGYDSGSVGIDIHIPQKRTEELKR